MERSAITCLYKLKYTIQNLKYKTESHIHISTNALKYDVYYRVFHEQNERIC